MNNPSRSLYLFFVWTWALSTNRLCIDIIIKEQSYIAVVYHLVHILCTFRLLNQSLTQQKGILYQKQLAFALALWQNDIREHIWLLLNLIALAALGLIVSGSSLPCWVNFGPRPLKRKVQGKFTSIVLPWLQNSWGKKKETKSWVCDPLLP